MTTTLSFTEPSPPAQNGAATALVGALQGSPDAFGTGGSFSWLASLGRPDAGLRHQERNLLADAAIAIDRDLAATGYQLTVVMDMHAFANHLRSVGKFVPNAFNADLKPAPFGEAAGLVLRNPAGDIVATHGVRLYRLQRSLADHLATLSLFYDDPIGQMLAGEYLYIDGDARRYAETVEDRATWIGGLWVRPDHRGKASNISTFLALAARLLASQRWGRTVVFSLTTEIWNNPKAAARIRNPDIYRTVKWWRPQLPEAERQKGSEILLVVTEPDVPFDRARHYLDGEGRLQIGTIPAARLEAAGG